MRSLAWKKPAGPATLTGHGILIMALMISFPVIGLDQFLRTAPSKFSEQPVIQIQHWLSDSLMAIPLFAVGIWAGDLIARRAGLGMRRPVKRALLISLLTALAMSLAWFQIDRTDNPVTAQPLIFPHAQDSGDVYWVVPEVIVALCCVCLVPAAIWAGRAIARGVFARSASARTAFARTAMLVLLVAAAPLSAWLLHQAAERAYSSQVFYTSTALSAHRGSRLPAEAATTAPFAFAYQTAHALQDGLAGQAAGFPVAVMALRSRRSPETTPRHTRQTPKGDA
jgi:uncharacterized membrane protein YoaK (UPF0700 family)